MTGAQLGLSLTASLPRSFVAHSKCCGDFGSDPEQRAHHTPRHFRIEPANPVRPDHEVRWVKRLLLDECQNGAINVYHLAGTVTNTGKRSQTSNVLQFVDIYVNDQKLDARGIPPLRRGQSYTFGFDFQRSSVAGDGTSLFRLQLDMRQPSGSAQDCNSNNDTFRLRV